MDPFEYDVDTAPDPATWLALDEGERIAMATRAHAGRFPDALHGDTNPIAHAALHAMVETQIASGEPACVAATLNRLTGEGLTRHASLHAIVDQLVQQIAALSDGPFDHERYRSALEAISAPDVVAGALAAPRPRAHPNRAARRAAEKRDKKLRGSTDRE